MNELAIKVRGLRKKYGSFTAVDNVDLDVKKGEIYGFLGPNGAGKTTVIRMLLGLSLPTQGNIEIFGQNLFTNRNKIVNQVGAVVEAPSFFEYMTAFENLSFLSRLSAPITNQKIYETLKLVGLEQVAQKKISTFSYGMKQRLGIAQALLPDNKLIFLDEPTNGLDPHGILGVRKLIQKLCHEHQVTVFLSSHLLAEVEQICDSVTIINHGKTICQGSIYNLITTQQHVKVIIPAEQYNDFLNFLEMNHWNVISSSSQSLPDINNRITLSIDFSSALIPILIKHAVHSNFTLFSVSSHSIKLEDLFVELTSDHSQDVSSDRF